MKKPEMIFFDFGETLITDIFSPIKGTQALLQKAVNNPLNISAEEVQEFAAKMISEFRKCNCCKKDNLIEVHNFQFEKYLYEYFDISFDISVNEMEQIFINESIKSKATPNIKILLEFLNDTNIRTGVISNISFSGNALNKWLQKDLPFNKFDIIIATSEYVFRKPSKFIFEIALRKANLPANRVWYCGNNFFCDVIGAFNSGLQPVWYKGAKWEANSYDDSFPYIEISDWRQLKDFISRCE